MHQVRPHGHAEHLVGELDLADALGVEVDDVDLHEDSSSPLSVAVSAVGSASSAPRHCRSVFFSGGRGVFCRLGLRLRQQPRRERNVLRQAALFRIRQQHDAALRAGDAALDHDQAAPSIRRHDLKVLHGRPRIPEMARHLLALEHLAGILALAGRAVGPVRDGNTVARAQTGEVVPLHAAGEALADGGADRIDELARGEVVGAERGTHVHQRILAHAELNQMALGLYPRLGEVAALGAGGVLDLYVAGTELQGDVAALILGPLGDDLTAIDAQHGHRHMLAVIVEDTGHAEFLGYHARAPACCRLAGHDALLQPDLDIDPGGEVELHERVYGLRRRIDDIKQPLVGADLELLT